MTINHFLEHWRTKITDTGEICGASREAQNIKRMRGCILLILLSLDAPGMSSNHRGRPPGARRSEDASRQSAGVRRSFFANNSSASPAEDVLGLVPLTGGRRAVVPSSTVARVPLLSPVRHCVQNGGLLQIEPSKAS